MTKTENETPNVFGAIWTSLYYTCLGAQTLLSSSKHLRDEFSLRKIGKFKAIKPRYQFRQSDETSFVLLRRVFQKLNDFYNDFDETQRLIDRLTPDQDLELANLSGRYRWKSFTRFNLDRLADWLSGIKLCDETQPQRSLFIDVLSRPQLEFPSFDEPLTNLKTCLNEIHAMRTVPDKPSSTVYSSTDSVETKEKEEIIRHGNRKDITDWTNSVRESRELLCHLENEEGNLLTADQVKARKRRVRNWFGRDWFKSDPWYELFDKKEQEEIHKLRTKLDRHGLVSNKFRNRKRN